MLKKIAILIPALLLFVLTSCSNEKVVAEYGKYKISLEEFEQMYAKHNGGVEQAKNDSLPKLKSFLDMYVVHKMKLREAKVRGYHEKESIKKEIEDNRKTIGAPYLEEKELIEPGLKALYEKRKEEFRASHIMFRLNPATGGDAQVLEFANKVLDSIKNGTKTFEEMAAAHSEDVYSKNTGGDIFYLTAGLLPVEFEDAVYSLKVGEIYPQVVKTSFGFHIIKLTEKKPRIPSVRASHILVDFYDDKGNVDTVAARLKMDTVVNQLKTGLEFSTVARRFSEDPGTKELGGDLGFFERRMMVKEFDEAAFTTPKGQLSDVVKSNFGYHIIKVTDIAEYPKFEADKENLKKIYQSQRYNLEKEKYVSGLKTKYNYALNNDNFNYVLKISDSVKVADEHPKISELKDKEIFKLAGKSYTFKDVVSEMQIQPDFAGRFFSYDTFMKGIEKIVNAKVMEEEASLLETKYPEFKNLMTDFVDGIYVFNLQEEVIWRNLKIDSVELRKYWEGVKENYITPDKVNFSEIFAASDSTIKALHAKLKAGELFDTLAAKYSERNALKRTSGNYGLVDVASSPMAQKAYSLNNADEYSEPFAVPGGWAIVKLVKKEPSRMKTYEEARPEVSSAFQEIETKKLENQFNEKLNSLYKPVYHYEELENAFKSK